MSKNRVINVFISLVLVLGLIWSVAPLVSANDSVKVMLNGEHIAFDQAPVVENGRVLVPIRAVCEALGADVYWRGSDQTVWIIKNELKLILKIGEKYVQRALVDSHIEFFSSRNKYTTVIELDVASKTINGKAFLPIRAVCEELGAAVGWDESSRTVVITCPEDVINDKNTDIYFFENYMEYVERFRFANTTGTDEEENAFRQSQSSFRIYLNNTGGYPIIFGRYQPIMDQNGMVLVPVSSIPNVFQGGISYSVDGETVTIKQNGFERSTTVKVTIGSNIMYKDDVAIEMESAPMMHLEQIYIPLQPVGEAMEHRVYYDARQNHFAILYCAVTIYVWNENEDSSESGLRYAIFQGVDLEREFSEISSRAVSDFEEIKAQFNRVPPGRIYLGVLYHLRGHKVPYEVKDAVENEIIDRFGCICSILEYLLDEVPQVIQGRSEHADEWYSTQLAALGEGDIRNNEGQTYRFSYFPSFHEQFSIRVDVDADGTGVLTFSMCDGPINAYGGELIKSATLDLSKEQVNKLIESVDKNRFWDLPTNINKLEPDGSMWIVEGVNDGNYHMVERWSPSDGEIYELGNLFIELSGEEVGGLY